MIDLRSDTVTLPSPAMHQAIAEAPLGDDVYGEDPTVNELERLAAATVGKEAALLVPSGTMGNLAALLAHCGRGQKVVLGTECHIFNYEAGGASVLGGIAYHPLPTTPTGTLPLDAVAAALHRVDDVHYAPPGAFCLENTHNRCGGTVLPLAYLAAAHDLAQQAAVPLHLDGARLFNAALALGVDVREITAHVDTVQFCLSKGLAAPVGSVLAGSTPFIAQARRMRKLLGGAMRQAGVIAAAGIVALTTMIDRLADDHGNARRLAEGLARIPGLTVDLDRVQTNIVIFGLAPDAPLSDTELVAALRERGLLVGGMGPGRIRAVTHYGIDATHIDEALTIIADALAATPASYQPVGGGGYR